MDVGILELRHQRDVVLIGVFVEQVLLFIHLDPVADVEDDLPLESHPEHLGQYQY